MTGDTSASELRNTWEAAAPGWARWEHVFATSLSGATGRLLDSAGVREDMHILDVACGAGSQSIEAAKRVGPAGSVVASDISASMLEHVRRNAARAGLRNVETLECEAEDLAGHEAAFDAAICRMGLMLFPSPGQALQAVRHALRPGARFSALVFTTPADNPFMAQPMAILLRHAGRSPPAAGQPGIFALGGDGAVEGLLADSGFVDVKTEAVRAPLVLPSASDAVQLLQEAAGAYRAVVAELGEADRSRAWGEVHDCLKQFESGARFETELAFVIGSGARPKQGTPDR